MLTAAPCIPTATWHGCYDGSWRDLIVPDAFAHPAKFAPELVRRIYSHGISRSWWRVGDLIGDPFGGIAGGGIMAGYAGLNWIGSELESRFVELGNRNLAKHRTNWKILGSGNSVVVKLVQGDSRRFAEIVGAAAGIVTSPPYAVSQVQERNGIDRSKMADGNPGGPNSQTGALGYGASAGQIGALAPGTVEGVVTSPPYADSINSETNGIDWTKSAKDYAGRVMHDERIANMERNHNERRYGASPGQIGALKSGDIAGVVTSPPFRDARSDTTRPVPPPSMNGEMAKDGGRLHRIGQCDYGDDPANIGDLQTGTIDGVVTSPPYGVEALGHKGGEGPRTTHAAHSKNGTPNSQVYGSTSGQIGDLASSGTVDGVVTSPPYEASLHPNEAPEVDLARLNRKGLSLTRDRVGEASKIGNQGYSPNADNIGNDSGETYWQAMSIVYGQCLLALRPGGVLACVVKDYVQNKKRVPLCDQTLRLLTHLGFEPVERIHAMLVREHVDHCMFSGPHVVRKERKSFFRRLAEKKGSPRIDWEEVLVVRKAGAA